jgi:hypothetical protein
MGSLLEVWSSKDTARRSTSFAGASSGVIPSERSESRNLHHTFRFEVERAAHAASPSTT